MATFDEVMTALRNADASGNNEDAARLAQIAQRLRSSGGGSAGAQTSAPTSPPTDNPLYGALQTTEKTVGGAMTALGKARDVVQQHVPDSLGQYVPHPSTDYMKAAGKGLQDAGNAINFDNGTVGEAYARGGIGGALTHLGGNFVAGAPHVLAAANPLAPVTIPLDLLGQTETNAEDRARNDGRQDPGASDYLVGGGTAALQEVAGRIGGRAIAAPVVRSGVAPAARGVAKAALTDTAAGGVGSEAQYLGTHVGTQTGTTPEGIVNSAVEGGLSGAVGGTVLRSGVERLPRDREAALGLKGEQLIGKAGEDQAGSSMRVAQAADALRKQADAEGTLSTAPQESNVYKSVQKRLISNLRQTVDGLTDAQEITPDQRAVLIGKDGTALHEAGTHNHLFEPGEVNAHIDSLDLEDTVKQTLKDGFRDLNTATYNSMWKNGSGPLEKAAKWASAPVAAGGAMLGGFGAAPVAWAASRGLQGLGRAGDNALGFRSPPAESSLTALRAAALKRQSLADAAGRDTFGDLKSITGQSRQQTQALADFKRAADAETAFQTQRARTQAAASAKAENAAKGQEKAQAATERRGLQEFAEAARQEQEFQAQREAVRKAKETPPPPPITTKPPLPPSVQAIKDAQAEDRPLSKLSSGYLQGRARSLLKERADQQEQASKEAARQRLSGSVSPDAPISGGHLATVANWFRKQGHAATIEHVQEAVDRLNARGGFSSPEQYRAAREGHEFPGDSLVPLFKETGAVLRDHGIHADTDVKAGEKADATIVRAKVRALVSEAMPKAPRSPVEVPSVANTNQRPPQAPPRPRGPRKTPGGPAEAPPSTTGFEEGRRLHAYAATTFRAKMAEEQAIRSAGNRLDLQETASHIAGLEHKDAKAQAYAEALKKYHGDAEALRFVMGPLRTLADIGGKSEQTANQKAVIKVRSKKKSS